jgi:hypothetical protein
MNKIPELPDVPLPELQEVPLVKDIIPEPNRWHRHHHEPTHEEIALVAYRIWEDEGKRSASQQESDANWFEAKALLIARHCG